MRIDTSKKRDLTTDEGRHLSMQDKMFPDWEKHWKWVNGKYVAKTKKK